MYMSIGDGVLVEEAFVPYLSFQDFGAFPSPPLPLAQHLSMVWPTLLGQFGFVQIGCSCLGFVLVAMVFACAARC